MDVYTLVCGSLIWIFLIGFMEGRGDGYGYGKGYGGAVCIGLGLRYYGMGGNDMRG